MKRLLTGAFALLLPIAALATTLNPVQLLNPTGSTSGQAIVSTGSSTAPAWANVSATALAAQAANTVIGNATSSSASPTPITVTGCNGSAQALQWTNGSGFGCNSAIATSGANSNITSLSGLSTALSVAQGGTGAISSAAALTNLGAAPIASPTFTGTVTAAALTATGVITPSQTAGIVGTTTNNNANAGSVGEVVASAIVSPGSSITNATPSNVTSISLTAGDWDVWGNIYLVPAGSTVVTQQRGTIATTSAAMGTYGDPGSFLSPITLPAGNALTESIGPVRISLASTTTVYLVQQTAFTTSTCTAFGQISARRRR